MIRGKLWIVTDENQILKSLFYKEIPMGVSHNQGIKEFVNENKLEIVVREDDYHEAPCIMAELGHIVIKSEDSIKQLIFYIPENITDRQLEWFLLNQAKLSDYIQIGAYSLHKTENQKIEWKKLHGMNEIMVELNRKNLKNAIKKENSNVR